MGILIYLLIVICVAGAVAMLINKAPFIDAQYKPYALWFVLLIVVVLIIYALVPFIDGLSLPRRY